MRLSGTAALCMRKLARNWLDYARSDLTAARHLSSAEGLGAVASFHCQQCIEKSLKSLLEFHDRTVPRIHDLITLHGQVSEIETIPLDENILRQINDTYIDTRYPLSGLDVVVSEPSSDKVKQFIETTETVLYYVSRIVVPTDESEQSDA